MTSQVKKLSPPKVVFMCSFCGQVFNGRQAHQCEGSLAPKSKRFIALHVFRAPPPDHSNDIPELRKIIHSITCTASAAATLQLIEERGLDIPDVPCGAHHRMSLITSIETLGELAGQIIETMEDR